MFIHVNASSPTDTPVYVNTDHIIRITGPSDTKAMGNVHRYGVEISCLDGKTTTALFGDKAKALDLIKRLGAL